MKILIALTYYLPHYSGLTIYAGRVARALAARGHEVTILTSQYDPKLPLHEFHDGVEVFRLKVWLRISKGVVMPSIAFRAWQLIRNSDIVQLHVPQLDAAPIALLGQLLGKPVILTYHCDLRLPEGAIHRMANIASNFANHITAHSANTIIHNTRDYAKHSPFLSRYMDKMVPIYPPIETRPITNDDIQAFINKFDIQENDRVIGMAARFASEKGVEYLARALPAVLEVHPKARVLFVGPYQKVIGEEDYAKRLMPLLEKLNDHWSFLGVLSPTEMSVFFHISQVTVLPSINSTESYGMVQVESMDCGTPVVSVDLPGVRIPVRDTGMGLIVPPKDSESISRAIIEILNRKGEKLGDPQALIERSSPEHVAALYEDLYKRSLSR